MCRSPLVCFDDSLHTHNGGTLKRTITALSIAAALMLAGCSTDAADGGAAGTEPSSTAGAESAATQGGTSGQAAETAPKAEEVPSEYKSALKSAETYATMMDMSKAGVYDQLVSEFGGKFSPESAQYAIDNVKADWNANALASAKTYQESMAMSPEAIREQLTSEFGGKFTPEEADYAVTNLP